MFERVNRRAGTTATLHALRHTAAYRMAEDPTLPLTDVQMVLGHAQLTTTQIYLTPRKEDVVRRVLAHHAEQGRRVAERAVPKRASGYRADTLGCCSARPARERTSIDRSGQRRDSRTHRRIDRHNGVCAAAGALELAGDTNHGSGDVGAAHLSPVQTRGPRQAT